MDIEKLIEDLRGLLKQYGEKIPYGELVGAPWPYSRSGDLVWQDPEPYFIEQAATALSTLQAENSQLRADLEYEREYANAYHEECEQGEIENAQLRAELEQVKAERDAAVESIPHECKTCVYHTVFFNGCTPDHDCTNPDGGCSNNCDRWKWRGRKEG